MTCRYRHQHFSKTDNQLIALRYTQWVNLGIRKYKGKTPRREEEPWKEKDTVTGRNPAENKQTGNTNGKILRRESRSAGQKTAFGNSRK